MKLTTFETTMLQGWEQVHNKAQLSLWILVAIGQKKGCVDEILAFIRRYTTITTEGQSLYRSLRRLEGSTLIESIKVPSAGGPYKKQFVLTEAGERVLGAFVERNVTNTIVYAHKKGFFNVIKRGL